MKRVLLLLMVLTATSAVARQPAVDIGTVAFKPTPGAAVPADIRLNNAEGDAFTLGSLFGRRPIVLMLGYYHCPNLCGAVWAGLASAIAQLDRRPGRDFEVLIASIDPEEGPPQARERRDALMRDFDRAGIADWTFATGTQPQIQRLADAVGYGYRYDPEQRQYAHAAGILVLDTAGHIARYLAGVQFDPQSLRLGIVAAAQARADSRGGLAQAFANQVLLLCYHYDPSQGRYSSRINQILQIGCIATVLALAALVLWLRRREQQAKRERES